MFKSAKAKTNVIANGKFRFIDKCDCYSVLDQCYQTFLLYIFDTNNFKSQGDGLGLKNYYKIKDIRTGLHSWTAVQHLTRFPVKSCPGCTPMYNNTCILRYRLLKGYILKFSIYIPHARNDGTDVPEYKIEFFR